MVVWLSIVAAFGVLVIVAIVLRRLVHRLTRLTAAVSDGLGRVSMMDERLTAVAATMADDLRPRLNALADGVSLVSGGLTELKRTSTQSYNQLEAYVDVRSLIRPRAPMPALRGWAASPDVLRLLAEQMRRRRPKLIVECGSGSSSIWLGYLAECLAPARVVCLEHDERFAENSRDLIDAHDLGDVVEVRLAPLTEWKSGTRTYSWYDTEALADLTDIGLLFVDGPPGTVCPQARYPAIPLLLPRCGAEAVVVLDDTRREEEKAISDRWLADHPELERSVLPFDKGAHVFTRRTTCSQS